MWRHSGISQGMKELGYIVKLFSDFCEFLTLTFIAEVVVCNYTNNEGVPLSPHPH